VTPANDPQNFYRQRDILPSDQLQELGKAKIIITNFHFHFCSGRRRRIPPHQINPYSRKAGGLSLKTPDQMVRRVCRELGGKKNINRHQREAQPLLTAASPDGEEEKLTGDDLKRGQKRDEAARVWISGLEAVKEKLGIKGQVRSFRHSLVSLRFRLCRRNLVSLGGFRFFAH